MYTQEIPLNSHSSIHTHIFTTKKKKGNKEITHTHRYVYYFVEREKQNILKNDMPVRFIFYYGISMRDSG